MLTKREASQLSREKIVAAALKLTHVTGLKSLTINRLCDELDVTPPAVYYYVANKQALLELVADEVIASIEFPTTGTWDQRLVELVMRSRETFRRYPGVAAYTNVHRPSPAAVRLADVAIRLLLEGGLEPATALSVYHALTVYNFGQMLLDSPPNGAQRRGGRRPSFLPRAVRDSDHYPALQLVQSQLDGLDPGETLRQGLVWMLTGVRQVGTVHATTQVGIEHRGGSSRSDRDIAAT